jgi:hypothetical protein
MRKTFFPSVAAVLAAGLLAACAGPWPGAMPLNPGAVGAGPLCGPQQYPFTALQDFRRGQAIVRAEVGPDTRLVKPVVEQPAFDPHLTAAAPRAVQQCSLPQARPGSQVRLLVAFDFFGQEEYLPRGVVTVLFAPVPAAQ